MRFRAVHTPALLYLNNKLFNKTAPRPKPTMMEVAIIKERHEFIFCRI